MTFNFYFPNNNLSIVIFTQKILCNIIPAKKHPANIKRKCCS